MQILVSPILAGLAVGIGVPILLFYVYGVVPVSLCRSGGCGVSTSGSGVRFDFDDENELMGALGARNTGDAASIDVASHRGGNPSIGEASLSLGSGSQLEKLGRENDLESASIVAMAGSSIAGSIASSVLPGGQRLEVQADVTSSQRFSLCSETASATTSLSEKSVNASIALDDGSASTRALAGSVLNMKLDPTSRSSSTEAAASINSTSGATTSVPAPTIASMHQESSSGQATSLSSLEEMTANLAKRARRRPIGEKQSTPTSQQQSNSEPEDTGSERVRFDHHVSFVDVSEESTKPSCSASSSAVSNRGPKRKKIKQDQIEQEEIHRTMRFPTSDKNSPDLDADENSKERVNVTALRNVFFYNSPTCTDKEKRLQVIEEPISILSQTDVVPHDSQLSSLDLKSTENSD
ncbi:hypothetical protein TKK_0017353 [Trichogramma kaykai]